MLCGLGYNVSKGTLLDYLAMAREAYLLFEVKNAVAKFVEREGNPKRYFSDNGLLNLFLIGKEPTLLENEVAVAMRDVFGEKLHYLKSPKNGIDVDFYVPEQGLAVQVTYSLSKSAKPPRSRQPRETSPYRQVYSATTYRNKRGRRGNHRGRYAH